MSRHPCPYCTWELDAPPLRDTSGWTDTWAVMTALSARLEGIQRMVEQHMADAHPDEFDAAWTEQVDGGMIPQRTR